MSTRGCIGIPTSNGIVALFCHFDSYYSGLGRELLYNYQSDKQIASLIGEYREYGKYKNVTEYRQAVSEDVWIEYAYLLKDGVWYGARPSNERKWRFTKLTEKIVNNPNN